MRVHRILLLGLLLSTCVRSPADLAPFPCATDGSCPDDTVCTLDGVCVAAAPDVTCTKATRTGDSAADYNCLGGVLVPRCDGSSCDFGRTCVALEGNEKGCYLECVNAACPAEATCQTVGNRSLCLPNEVAGPGDGQGLLVEYFSGTSLAIGPLASNIVGPVQMKALRPPNGGTTNFSLRLTGSVRARFTGLHELVVISDDGARLSVSGTQEIDGWKDHPATRYQTGPLAFQAGSRYAVKLEHFQGIGEQLLELRWVRPDGVEELIPKSELFPGMPGQLVDGGTGGGSGGGSGGGLGGGSGGGGGGGGGSSGGGTGGGVAQLNTGACITSHSDGGVRITDIAVTPDGTLAVTGTWTGTLNASPDAGLNGGTGQQGFVALYSADGGLRWAKHLAAPSIYPSAIALTTNRVAVTGAVSATGSTTMAPASISGPNDGFFGLYDLSGTELMYRHFGGTGGTSNCTTASVAFTSCDLGSDLAADSAGRFVLVGSFVQQLSWPGGSPLTTRGASDGFVAVLNEDGTAVQLTQLASTGPDSAQAVCVGASGEYWVAGRYGGAFTAGTLAALQAPGFLGATYFVHATGGQPVLGLGFTSSSGSGLMLTPGGLASDGLGGVLYLGTLVGTMDLDPSGGSLVRTSSRPGAVLGRLSSSGGAAFANVGVSSGQSTGWAIAADLPNGRIYGLVQTNNGNFAYQGQSLPPSTGSAATAIFRADLTGAPDWLVRSVDESSAGSTAVLGQELLTALNVRGTPASTSGVCSSADGTVSVVQRRSADGQLITPF